MKRIVICFDGTWNALSDPQRVTNVVKLAQAVRPADSSGNAQIAYYSPGVGSSGPIDRFLGGVSGYGLAANVKRALAFLALNYADGDKIYVFGFSRGAYAARDLAGVISIIRGVPKRSEVNRLERIWSYYRSRRLHGSSTEVEEMVHSGVMIECVGVWDTVGSYGVPEGLGLDALRRFLSFRLYDTRLAPSVLIGLHALSIDEKRRAFAPTLWTLKADEWPRGRHLEQVWFAGVHANIGGGYERVGLSDLSLLWMIARVSDLTCLEFDTEFLARCTWPCPLCTAYRSDRKYLLSRLRPSVRQLFPARPRLELDEMVHGERDKANYVINAKLHWSVLERRCLLGDKPEIHEAGNLPEDIQSDLVTMPTQTEVDLIRAAQHSRTPTKQRCVDCAWSDEASVYLNTRCEKGASS